MLDETIRKKAAGKYKNRKTNLRELEWLILFMSGAALASLQIVHYVFLNPGGGVTVSQAILDWLFSMSIITFLVHISFREIRKVHDQLVIEREQANKAQARMKHIVDSTKDAILTFDEEGKYTFVNKSAEELTGYDAPKLLKMNIKDTLSPDYRSLLTREINHPRELSGKYLFVDVIQPGGSTIPVELSLMPIKDKQGKVSGFQGIARDVTERKEMERIREEKERQLEVVAKLGQLILETKDETPFKDILEVLGRFSDSHRAFAILSDNGNSHKGIIQQSYEWRRECGPHMENGATSNKDLNTSGDASTCSCLPPTLILPLIVGDAQIGIIGLEKSPDEGGWSTITTQLLATASTMISQAFERQKTNLRLKGHFQSLAGTVCRTMGYIDPYTASHQQRLAILARMVGERLEMDKERLAWLHFGGLMHDIGKMAVPSTILSKPGRLTDEEWVLLRSHPRRGYELLDNMNLPDFVTDMVLHHHERLDGSGYPSGMAGDELSREVRILGACDVVEAMSSHRPYRPARNEAEIIEELSKGKETKYDPQIVDMLVDIFRSEEFEQKFLRGEVPLVV